MTIHQPRVVSVIIFNNEYRTLTLDNMQTQWSQHVCGVCAVH